MNWDRGSGHWKQFKGKVKEQWGKLTDDEIDQIAGNREQLEGKIQERYGIAKDQVKAQVDAAMNRWEVNRKSTLEPRAGPPPTKAGLYGPRLEPFGPRAFSYFLK